jgi:uncharacterized RDD family membrane protein YckC
MQYEDRLTISTPEGVSLDVTLAGLGSRISAGFVDVIIQGAILLLLSAILGGFLGGQDFPDAGRDASDGEVLLIGLAIITVFMFVTLFFYSVFFETLWSGRTPGKRILGIRVVRDNGARIGFKASLIRNLVRFVDLLPSAYIVGMWGILASSKNQRIGDMVAGTLVIRDHRAPEPRPTPRPAGAPQGTESWDVSGITAEELATVRGFLERRYSIAPEARQKLALELERKLRAKVPGAPEWRGYPEVFLEHLAAVKSSRS